MNNMNISIKHYGIFYKDSRLLLRMAAVILIFQFVLMLTVPPLLELLKQFPNLDIGKMPLGEWFPKLQIAMNIIFSLIAAGHWWAEERGAKTDLLLRRLPISSRQLWTEKTLAGIVCVLSVFIIQIMWFWLLSTAGGFLLGIKMDATLFEYIYILFNVTVYAYFIGLPFSYRLNQTIGVIVIGIAMFMPGLWIAALIQTDHGNIRNDTVEDILSGLSYIMSILPLLLVICVPFLMYLYFSWKYSKPMPQFSKPFRFLVYKQYREMRVYFMMAVLLLILSFVSIVVSSGSTENLFALFMCCSIITASLLTGIASYTHEEKGGLNSVLYHHPIPLSHVYWSKILPSLGIATILSLSFVIIFFILLFNDTSGMALKLFGRPTIESVILNQLLVSNVLIPLCVMIFFAGLLPYTVGVLISHIVPNTVYAFIESVPFGIGAVVCFLYLQFANDAVMSELIMNDSNVRPLPSVPWVLIVLSALLLTAGWRSATDRRLLTATVLQRQFYILRLYLTVIAVTMIAFKVGLWDSLYLVTGIDLGIG